MIKMTQKENKSLLALAMVAISLTSCGGSTLSISNASSSSYSVSSSTTDSSSSVDEDLIDPFPVNFVRMNAPTDYKGTTPWEAWKTLSDTKDIYFLMDHKMGNSNSYDVGYGKVDVTYPSLGSMEVYSQDVYTLGISEGTSTYTQFVTKGQVFGDLLSFTVNGASRQVEDVVDKTYKTIDSKTTDASDFSIDGTGLDAAATVSAWDSPKSYKDRSSFLEVTGHDLFELTNYYVPDTSAILDVEVSRLGEDENEVDMTFSTNDEGGKTDASTWYAKEQSAILGATIDSDTARITIAINSLAVKFYVDDDWNITKTETSESYTANVFIGSSTNPISLDITNEMTTLFTVFENESDIADKRVWDFYDETRSQIGKDE